MSVEDPELLFALAVQKKKLDAGRIEFLEGERNRLRGELHKTRGELDGAKRSLDTQRRLLGEATERAELLKQSRARAYSVIDTHAGRLDELTAAIGRGDTEEATRLAEAWDRRE